MKEVVGMVLGGPKQPRCLSGGHLHFDHGGTRNEGKILEGKAGPMAQVQSWGKQKKRLFRRLESSWPVTSHGLIGGSGFVA